jgi:hypothetical protein
MESESREQMVDLNLFSMCKLVLLQAMPATRSYVKTKHAFPPGKAVVRRRAKTALTVSVLMILAGAGRAQTLTDITNAPTPGPNDISQTRTSGNTTFPDSLNYYTDNQAGWQQAGEPGQTFTTRTSSAGYVLTSLALKTGGLGSYSGIGTAQPYYLHIYSVSGSAVNLLQTYTSGNVAFNDGDWLQWTNLAVPLATNATYAWSFGRTPSGTGYEAMAVASANRYSGGEIALIPTNGGSMILGSSHNYDAVFVVGLATNSSLLLAGAPTVSPAITNYLGATARLSSAAVGNPPLRYQWQTDGGGGTLTNLPNATNASLTVTQLSPGPFRFDYIVTNASGRATSSVATVTAIVGTPVVSPANTNYFGTTVTLMSPAGTNALLRYQWQTDGGGGALTNLPGATNMSLTTTPPGTGTFRFDYIVTDSAGSFTSSVAAVTVLPSAAVTVDAARPMATMPLEGLAVASAVYDNGLTGSGTAGALIQAGIKAVRYPGGSYADIFHWQNYTSCGGYLASGNNFDNFMSSVVIPAGARAIITANYGSDPTCTMGGDPNEAADWVHYANITKGYGITYWEIGNEIGGNGYYGDPGWEYDLHYPYDGNRTGQYALSPTAVGSNTVAFIQAMKAQDPTIKCGVGIGIGSSDWAENEKLFAGSNGGVTCGSLLDFVYIHWYPGGDAATLLQQSSFVPGIVTAARTQFTNVLGRQLEILVTETGAGNVTGAPAALFAADNFLTWIENGISNVDYQELHNGFLASDNTLLGPACGARMARLLADVGDTMLKTTSGQSLLRVHAAVRQDGKMGILLMNTDSNISIPAAVTVNGPTLADSGTWYQFGLTNFIGTNVYPGYPVSTNTVSGLGNSFTISIPAYTMIALLIPLAATNTAPVLTAIDNRVVNVGSNVVFTASATDTDSPPQTLTFSLVTAPAGATVNASSGAFSWRPAVSDAGTTNVFALQVTDSGTPGLSATQSFTVTVNPLTRPSASSVALNNSRLNFRVSGQSGPDYAVQASTNLSDWSTIFMTNSPAMPFAWTDTNTATMAARFYRIKVGPPLP